MSVWCILEPLIPLNEACDPDEQCEDPNADCIGGFCLCTARFYENNGVCGKQTVKIYRVFKF